MRILLLDLLRGESSRDQKGPFFPTSLTPRNKSIRDITQQHRQGNGIFLCAFAALREINKAKYNVQEVGWGY
jgi:hypothetical protein